ncbi:2-hydroxyacid dehydrogenase [Pseudochryseolinea flava]|uniref:2-hydroxyacid dehydrogenase n=1 Tax=Pseudochryseolinea flava TaxID=2059302 RepID=A0A364XVG1_9BACT|nr:2-hydroxyacid dehydrogenase [Pseudochryseolinea flava]RAV98151.1 2-hydroxyacid dehydrogenase [Pseudochryseolinea flava]
MKVLVFSSRSYDRAALIKMPTDHALFFTERRLTKETVHLASGHDAVSLFTSDDGSGTVLDMLHGLGVRYVLLRSAGYDHVDIQKANTLGMRVAHVPEYSPNSVAEHAVAMLMAVNRKIIQGQLLMQLQDFRIDSLMGFDIHGKTVGVIGTGKIGRAFANIMTGFGAKVMAYDPAPNQEAIEKGVQYGTLQALLSECDVISIHCPLKAETKHLFSHENLKRMKAGAILINTSRGAVIDTVALIESLAAGHLGGACLDVYEFERGLFFEDHTNESCLDANFIRLRSFKNVLITAHQGFLTQDAVEQIAGTTLENLNRFSNHLACSNELTVWKSEVANRQN